MILFEILLDFFRISLLSIGGGYAALPVIKSIAVDGKAWLTLPEFADLLVISEMMPGPIIFNSAVFIGTKAAGLPGAAAAVIGCIIGPSVIVSAIAFFYFKFRDLPAIKTILGTLRPAVVALIASAGVSIFILTLFGEAGFSLDIGNINYLSAVLFIIAVIVLRKIKLSPLLVMAACGALGGVVYSLL